MNMTVALFGTMSVQGMICTQGLLLGYRIKHRISIAGIRTTVAFDSSAPRARPYLSYPQFVDNAAHLTAKSEMLAHLFPPRMSVSPTRLSLPWYTLSP